MPLYRKNWPNGDVTFVYAKTPEAALVLVAGTTLEELLPCETFSAHFVFDLDHDPSIGSGEYPWRLEGFGMETVDMILSESSEGAMENDLPPGIVIAPNLELLSEEEFQKVIAEARAQRPETPAETPKPEEEGPIDITPPTAETVISRPGAVGGTP